MKSTAVETEARVLKVARWLIDGWNRAKICQHARETEGWTVSDSQLDRYIAKAREKIRNNYRDDWKTNCAMANARLESLYNAAVDKGDLRTALSIVKEQVALQKPEGKRAGFETEEDFRLCMVIYAEALRRVVPPAMLAEVIDTTKELSPVAESFEGAGCFDYDGVMQAAVEDKKTLGRYRTREELIEDGFFDGLELPA